MTGDAPTSCHVVLEPATDRNVVTTLSLSTAKPLHCIYSMQSEFLYAYTYRVAQNTGQWPSLDKSAKRFTR